MTKAEKAEEIYKRLKNVYPNPRTALVWNTPLELLIATILSAQCTDKVVNTVTPELFQKYPNAQSFASSTAEEVDKLITKVTFHRNKAKNVVEACKLIVEKHGGEVPKTMEELDDLPGVARKTANVVLTGAFGIPSGITVDTHVMRLSKKLGLTDNTDPVKVEQDLMAIVPKNHWIEFPHLLILHGRDVCTARPHTCEGCPLADLCPDMKI